MKSLYEMESFDLEKFARSLERDCQEGVKWEIRKLDWIREERRKADLDEERAA